MSATLSLKLPSATCCCLAFLWLDMRLTILHRLLLVNQWHIYYYHRFPCAVLRKMLLRLALKIAPRLPPDVSISASFNVPLELLWSHESVSSWSFGPKRMLEARTDVVLSRLSAQSRISSYALPPLPTWPVRLPSL